MDSDGTLIVARGKLTGDTDYTREMTLKHKKQLLGIDLNFTRHFNAASLIASWIKIQHVEILNVAGPRTSEDSEIYLDVLTILEKTIQILREKGERKADRKSQPSESPEPPKTVEEAVDILIAEISLRDKTALAKMDEGDLPYLHFTLGIHIRNRFLYPRNDKLLESCREIARDKYLHWDQAAIVIIKELWKKLRDSQKLRVENRFIQRVWKCRAIAWSNFRYGATSCCYGKKMAGLKSPATIMVPSLMNWYRIKQANFVIHLKRFVPL
jgi:hypothetical protein